ncbi:MAG: VWA domain-containing protein [Gammaproteobacteria bacterium]|nr:VWA domain-containing protein [Gammaproteobacteria bacterium]
MTFAFPLAFLALLLLLPVVLVLRRSARWTQDTASTFKGRPPAPVFFTVRIVLACLFFAALTAVAARPYVAYEKSANLVFVIDVSRSMHARFSCSEPTFLTRAKNVLKKTLAAIPEARVSLFAFDRFAFPVTQLTTDRNYLFDVIENGLYVGLMLEATQTEIANALSVVAAKRERLPEIYGNVTHVVVFSDGHVSGDFRRRLQAPIEKLQGGGVKVSTVGIGNPAETPIADADAGQCIGRHIEVSGDKVMIPLRADILKFIATETGGSYFTEAETDRLIAALRAELEYDTGSVDARNAPRRDVSGAFLAVATLALLGFVYLPARIKTG